jgi:1-deoxy-D-xylulose-5-phosphate synthase
MRYKLLNKINSSQDVKKVVDFKKLCEEIRHKLIEVISANGGHLASNLGVVELTVALHKVFEEPNDKIVWDVGHQCYTHKILTGRLKNIETIRKEDGLSGFTNKFESNSDSFVSGHSSTSISAGLGLAYSNGLQNKNGHVVVVIGDGALTGGLAYEGLNNAGHFNKNFIVVLNDNKMSISKNVGAIAKYLGYVRTRPSYMSFKKFVTFILNKTPFVGKSLDRLVLKSKAVLKSFFYKSTLFEDMGFAYYGPVDGHNIQKLEELFVIAKNLNQPVLLHVVTKKGKGYEFAEKNPKKFHGLSQFEISTGKCAATTESFSSIFGKEICKLAAKDTKICAITAAMSEGTSLLEFKKTFTNRFFDVGIAEEHAVTFAGGLATGGMIPVFAVYSSFLQRSYDQIIHDAALQKIKVTIAVDRAGLVGEDGETHQGIFDVSIFNSIPNVTMFAPSFFDELKLMLKFAIYSTKNLSIIRYPKGGEFFKPENFVATLKAFDLYGEANSEILVVTYGRIFSNVCLAQKKLRSNEILIKIMKLNIIKPIDAECFEIAMNQKKIFFFEESIKSGGVAEKFGAKLAEMNFCGEYHITAIKNEFIKHASVMSQLKKSFLDAESIADKILKFCS